MFSSSKVFISSKPSLYAWGYGGGGGIGDGDQSDRLIPSAVSMGFGNWMKVAASRTGTSSYAIRDDGILFAWGNNGGGVLGTPIVSPGDIIEDFPIKIGSKKWKNISCGLSHVAAIDESNELYTWGFNGKGQIGNGTAQTGPYDTPTKVNGGFLGLWRDVACGEYHNVAIDYMRSVYAWGYNLGGQIGNGTTPPWDVSGFSDSVLSPTLVDFSHILPFVFNFKKVAAGSYQSFAISTDGRLFAWGMGALGDGTYRGATADFNYDSAAKRPIQIGIDLWKDISAGNSHVLAIREDGKLFHWGGPPYTNWMNQGSEDILAPTQIDSSNWLKVSAGSGNSFAIREDGKLFAWGHNLNGKLGDGTQEDRTSPTQIGNKSWKDIAAGGSHTLGIS